MFCREANPKVSYKRPGPLNHTIFNSANAMDFQEIGMHNVFFLAAHGCRNRNLKSRSREVSGRLGLPTFTPPMPTLNSHDARLDVGNAR